MKQFITVDAILASTYECAQQCARTSGIEHGWKFLYSGAHILGTRGGTVVICDCAAKRADYSYLLDLLITRDYTLLYQPYIKELL